MHFLTEARKHPDDIDAKLSQEIDYTIDGTKRIELREFAQGDWKENYAKDPNLFYFLKDEVDESVKEINNYPPGILKELL
jgi:hypothetical protein